jgi:hypothetical protein
VLGQFEKARKHLARAVELLGGLSIRKFGQVLVAAQTAPFLLAQALVVLGYPITALGTSKSGLDTARQRSGPYYVIALSAHIGTYLILRDIRPELEQVEELAAISAENEMPILHAQARFYRGWLMVNVGRAEEGLGEMGLGIMRLSGAFQLVDWFVAALADVCCRNGLPDEGLAAIKDALTRSEKTPYLQAEFYRLMGEFDAA